VTAPVAGDFDYEAHGSDYRGYRRADPRIAARVLGALGDARTVVNVGAGAGSYEPVDRSVVAVEPSASMRSQRHEHPAPVIAAVAERLPFADGTFGAAMAMVTVHQWPDPDRGLRELRRVSRGPVVVLTFEGEALDRLWLADYAPELYVAERRRYPAIDHIRQVLGGTNTVEEVPVPIDCTDGFTEAFYARPERFLDPEVRRNQSAWGFVEPDATARAVDRLTADLDSGAWDRAHGALRRQPEFVGALRLVVSVPGGDPLPRGRRDP
jgi:SAM-dependent methyltransferase